MRYKNNYQMLRKIKRLGMMNAHKELEKLDCKPVYNSDTKRYVVPYVCFSDSENVSKEETDKMKKIKELAESAKVDFDPVIFIDDVPEED